MVFRDLHSLGTQGDKKVTFTDETFETSTVFRNFLRLIVEGDCLLKARPPIVNLAHFIQKWDCPVARRTLLAYLRDYVARVNWGEISPLTVFVAGAILDCFHTCVWALDQPRRVWGDDPDNYPARCGKAAYNVFNPAYWPIVLFKQVPLNYSWALQNAMNDWDGTNTHAVQPLGEETAEDYNEEGEEIRDKADCTCNDDLACLFTQYLDRAQAHL